MTDRYEDIMSTLGCLLAPAAPARKVMTYVTEQKQEITRLREQLADAEKLNERYASIAATYRNKVLNK